MAIYFSILTFIYCSLVIWLIWHWSHIQEVKHAELEEGIDIFFSIVIPVRNEAKNILHLLNDLTAQQWKYTSQISHYFEVIVVDDHSEDNTAQLVKNQIPIVPFKLKLLQLASPDNFSGSHKKLALTQGIQTSELSTGTHVIITTDGDCRVGPNWLASYYDFFGAKKAELVSGPVTFFEEDSTFKKLQTIEFSSLIGVGAACIHAKTPNMCNGANLAFRKEAFVKLQGYEGNLHIPSGDDEFFLQKVFKNFPEDIYFIKNPDAIVLTHAKNTWNEFYQQRRRWAGKWKYHNNWQTALLAIFIFTFHLSWIITLIQTMLSIFPIYLFLILTIIKVTSEYFFLGAVLRFLKKTIPFFYFLILQIAYPFYVILFGIASNLGTYTWKGRKY